MVKKYCDICKEEISEKEGSPFLIGDYKITSSINLNATGRSLDVCDKDRLNLLAKAIGGKTDGTANEEMQKQVEAAERLTEHFRARLASYETTK